MYSSVPNKHVDWNKRNGGDFSKKIINVLDGKLGKSIVTNNQIRRKIWKKWMFDKKIVACMIKWLVVGRNKAKEIGVKPLFSLFLSKLLVKKTLEKKHSVN